MLYRPLGGDSGAGVEAEKPPLGGERTSSDAPVDAHEGAEASLPPSDSGGEGAASDPSASDDALASPGEGGPNGQPACPGGMVRIRGEYCPAVVQECLRWEDKDHTNRAGRVDPNVCAEFRAPSVCVSKKRVPMDFCMDQYEWPNQKGDLPATRMTWVEAKANCESVGKRLCTDQEWTLACEGPNMKPYPFGDGYHRDSSACNIDRRPWIDPWANPFEVVDKRVPSGQHEDCRSDYGVYDIVGNVDEWVFNTNGSAHHEPWVSGLMGGHWVYGIRNRCRAITDSHEPSFSFYVTGARCCSAAPAPTGEASTPPR